MFAYLRAHYIIKFCTGFQQQLYVETATNYHIKVKNLWARMLGYIQFRTSAAGQAHISCWASAHQRLCGYRSYIYEKLYWPLERSLTITQVHFTQKSMASRHAFESREIGLEE